MELKYPLKVRAVWWGGERVCWIDTRLLPFEEKTYCTNDPLRLAKAIKDMEIRGAPAIGVAAALGIAAYASSIDIGDYSLFKKKVIEAIDILWKTRPTAYNLFWALERIKKVLDNSSSIDEAKESLRREALAVLEEDLRANIAIGEYGLEIIDDGDTIMTHCNAGALATAGYGTVGAVIRIAWYRGRRIRVITTETRPVLQGARLNTWEYTREGIPVTLITDNMAGYVIRKGLVDKIIVGADRITREGYVVNKIGTYMIALAAKRNNTPFYVAAPTSTIDLGSSINDVVIEERDPDEVRKIMGKYLITIPDIPVLNYAFDITDPDLVTGIITEKGIVYPPYEENLKKILNR